MFWGLVVVSLVMGLFMAIQPAINGQLRAYVGSPANAALISTSVSTITLLVYVFGIERKPWPSLATLQSGPWWMWVGGVLGAIFVAVSVVLVQKLGGAVAFSLIVLGQMVVALFMDKYGWFGTTVHEATPGRIAGVGLVVAGVAAMRLL
jgi:bacterial/archaeal transporter family-2 protein